jgi:hypothetical protein
MYIFLSRSGISIKYDVGGKQAGCWCKNGVLVKRACYKNLFLDGDEER